MTALNAGFSVYLWNNTYVFLSAQVWYCLLPREEAYLLNIFVLGPRKSNMWFIVGTRVLNYSLSFIKRYKSPFLFLYRYKYGNFYPTHCQRAIWGITKALKSKFVGGKKNTTLFYNFLSGIQEQLIII